MFTEDEIDRIGAGVAARTLPKPEWTHAAHFAAALWVLERPGLDMAPLIRAYNEATGVANTATEGYHETITRASLRAAAHARTGRTRAEALAHLLAGPQGRSDWLLAHWSRGRLFTPQARAAWVEPDLQPLPF